MPPKTSPSGHSNRQTVPPRHVLAALDEVFGFRQFRPNQREIVQAILAGRDVFAVMPTGGGKSLCYQLPAHLMEGTCLVVSPLISLMKDQVDAAKANGLRAEFLNSALPADEKSRVAALLSRGELDLLYLAPERLAMEWFLPRLKAVRLCMIAVDEAHCISEWGHDFRKDYLLLDRLVPEFPDVPVAAFTATATHRVQQDIVAKLGLRNPLTIRASFDRPNLFYEVTPKDDVKMQILEFVRDRMGESGIVYRMTRKDVESTAEFLRSKKIKALPYHAGLDNDTRRRNQEMFNRDKVNVVVATIAFGMGIDKSNIRYVVHGDLPKNIEGYYQETGRAGRDGEPAHCMLFYTYGDAVRLKYFIHQVEDPHQRANQERKLQEMANFGSRSTCRRQQILRYFGESYIAPRCGGCDVCMGDVRTVDVTREAQIVMSAVARTQEQSAAAHVVDIVTGRASEAVVRLGHDKIKTFSAGKDAADADWQRAIDDLLVHRCLVRPDAPDAPLKLTDAGRDVLFGRRGLRVFRSRPRVAPVAAPDGAKRKLPAPASGAAPLTYVSEEGLFEELRALRKKLARKAGVPPYVIFSDQTLRELARQKPVTLAQMREVSGVGKQKLNKYGFDFIDAIARHLGPAPTAMPLGDKPPRPLRKRRLPRRSR